MRTCVSFGARLYHGAGLNDHLVSGKQQGTSLPVSTLYSLLAGSDSEPSPGGWQWQGPGRETIRLSYLAKPHAKATKIVAPSVKFAMSLFDVYYQSRSRRRKLCQCCFWLRQHEVPKNSTRVDQDAGIKQGVPVQVHKGQNFAFINRTVVHNVRRCIYNSVPLVPNEENREGIHNFFF